MSSLQAFPVAARGALLAVLAAVLFGLSTPLVQRLGVGLGPFTTAALLYAGAALCGAALRRPPAREAALRRADRGRVVAMAALGAVAGPVALAWGLQRTSGASASLMLVLEAVFTALLARLLYAEALGHRVLAAMALMGAGALLLVADQGLAGAVQWLGLLAVTGATLAWAADNTLSRALADRDPGQVVLAKSLLGALASAVLGAVAGEPAPGAASALGLVAVGAAGYGLSLRCYLLAQRSFGAGRTGSLFSLAPFLGAVAAVMLGERLPGPLMLLGGLLMLAGVLLHLGEHHAHEHEHEALEHEHAHTHDDGHHLHPHAGYEAPPTGQAHSHPHRHEPQRHTHEHVPDLHHGHTH